MQRTKATFDCIQAKFPLTSESGGVFTSLLRTAYCAHSIFYFYFFLPICIYLASILNEGNLAVVLVHHKADTQFKGDMFLAECKTCFSYTQYVCVSLKRNIYL